MERIPLKYNDQFHPTGPPFLKNEKIFKNTFLSTASQTYSERCQKSKRKIFRKVVNSFQPLINSFQLLTIFANKLDLNPFLPNVSV